MLYISVQDGGVLYLKPFTHLGIFYIVRFFTGDVKEKSEVPD